MNTIFANPLAAAIGLIVSRIGTKGSTIHSTVQMDRSVTPQDRPYGLQGSKKLKTLKVNLIPELETVPSAPNVKSMNSPF